MSFAERLQQNYDPDGKKQKEERIQNHVKQIAYTTLKACERVSRSDRRVHGYYCIGYDEPEIAEDGRKNCFVYDTDFGRHKDSILAYAPGAAQCTYSRQVPAQIVSGVKRELEAAGFVNPIVRAEETTQKFKYGHTEFLHREKYDEFPAFVIYVDVRW